MSNAVQQKQDQGKGPDKSITSIVNAEEKSVSAGALSFDEVVSLAYNGNPPAEENWSFTVTFRRGHGNKPEGSLVEGETVKLRDGMVFNVTGTDQS